MGSVSLEFELEGSWAWNEIQMHFLIFFVIQVGKLLGLTNIGLGYPAHHVYKFAGRDTGSRGTKNFGGLTGLEIGPHGSVPINLLHVQPGYHYQDYVYEPDGEGGLQSDGWRYKAKGGYLRKFKKFLKKQQRKLYGHHSHGGHHGPYGGHGYRGGGHRRKPKHYRKKNNHGRHRRHKNNHW